jgi:hypothetical protein
MLKGSYPNGLKGFVVKERNCSGRMLRGKSKEIENNHTDKKVNVDVEDLPNELPRWPNIGKEGWNRT